MIEEPLHTHLSPAAFFSRSSLSFVKRTGTADGATPGRRTLCNPASLSWSCLSFPSRCEGGLEQGTTRSILMTFYAERET